MKKSEITALDSEELIARIAELGGRMTKEVNFGRTGKVTNTTLKQVDWVVDELSKRFGLDMHRILEIIKQ